MSAPFRISVKAANSTTLAARAAGGSATATATSTTNSVNVYLEKLIKMIPAEVVGLYLVGSGVIPAGQGAYLLGWTLFCLIAVVAVRALGTRDVDAKKSPQWAAVAISTVAFLIWIYSIGGAFQIYLGKGYQPFLGSLLVLAWTFVVPLFYNPAE